MNDKSNAIANEKFNEKFPFLQTIYRMEKV